MSVYSDPLIECTETEVRIHRYYPWGSKRVPYAAIRAMDRFGLGAMRGKYRYWGTGTLRNWFNLDVHRSSKTVGFYLDIGVRVRPGVTPADPDAFEAAVRAHLPSGR